MPKMKKRLGEMLIERGLITDRQLAGALALQRQKGMRLGAALVSLGHLTETQLVNALGQILRIKVVELGARAPQSQAVAMVNGDFAAMYELFPFGHRAEQGHSVLTVAMSDPMNFRVIDELGFMTNARIEPVLAKASDISQAILRHYGKGSLSTDMDGDSSEMVIIRSGQSEQTIDTSTGNLEPTPDPLENAPVHLAADLKAPAQLGPKRGQEISAVLLTDEVEDSVPVDNEVHTEPVQAPSTVPTQRPPGQQLARIQPVRVAPATSASPRPGQAGSTGAPSQPAPPIPLTEVKRSPGQPVILGPGKQGVVTGVPVAGRIPDPSSPSYFNEAVGALIDAAGGAVSADQVNALERKFWALMRLLAKKGLITRDEFLEELGPTDGVR